jgi:hypothetical protein
MGISRAPPQRRKPTANSFNLWGGEMKTPLLSSVFALSLIPVLGGCSFTGASKFNAIDPTPTGALAGAALSKPIVAANERSRKTLVSLPAEAGAPGRLTERLYANGLRQSVSLGAQKTLGDWNDLTIDVQTDAPSADKTTRAPMDKPTEAGVRHEILSRFPETPMRIVARPMRNVFGPFGLAVGAAEDGARCAYAWQWVDDIRVAQSGDAKAGNVFSGRETPASIRMRLCRKGVSADALAEWFEHLEVGDIAGLDRMVAAAREEQHSLVVANAAHKAARGDIVDARKESLEEALPHRPKPIATAPAPAKRVAAHKPEPEARPAPVRHVATRRRPAAEPAAGPAPVAASQPYLAAPAAGYASGAAFAPPQTQRLDPGLPAQAYRGPTASAAREAAPAPAQVYGAAQPRYLGQ